MRRVVWPVWWILIGCGAVEHGGAPPDAALQGGDDGGGGGADGGGGAIDAAPGTPVCTHEAPFESIAPVPGVNTSASDEHNPWLSSDERTIVFTRWPGGEPIGDFLLATRDSADGTFASEAPLSVNSDEDEWSAWLSDDLRTIYFDRRTLADSSWEVLVATRSSPTGDFGSQTSVNNVSEPNVAVFDPFVTAEGIYFSKDVAGNTQLWFAPAAGDGFDPAHAATGLNSAAPEEMPVVSADGMAIYFGARNRLEDGASWDVWRAIRPGPGQPYGDPERLPAPVNSAGREYPGWLSPDNCRLYFTSDASGDHDIWVAVRSPQ